ncbi:MAG: hypothetical protein ACRD4S_02680 [Candidatus Acidiferrales bacterium]
MRKKVRWRKENADTSDEVSNNEKKDGGGNNLPADRLIAGEGGEREWQNRGEKITSVFPRY